MCVGVCVTVYMCMYKQISKRPVDHMLSFVRQTHSADKKVKRYFQFCKCHVNCYFIGPSSQLCLNVKHAEVVMLRNVLSVYLTHL